MPASRREFLRRSGCAALSASAFASTLTRFGLVDALAQHHHHTVAPLATDYRALVCVFLSGGNDAWNTIVDLDDYASYASTRATIALRPGHASCPSTRRATTGRFGLHASLAGLHALLDAAEARRVLQRGHADRADHARAVPLQPRAAPAEPVLALRPGVRVADGGRRSPAHDRLGRAHGRPHPDHERNRALPHDRDAGGRHRLRKRARSRAPSR